MKTNLKYKIKINLINKNKNNKFNKFEKINNNKKKIYKK